MKIQAASKEELEWIRGRAGCVLTPGARGIEAIDDFGFIRGQVAYDNWTQNAVQCHMAVDSPIVWRDLRGPAFSYPFDEAGRGLILGIIPSHNAKSCELTRRFGFRESHRIRDGWAVGDDLIVFEMHKRDRPRWSAPERPA